MFINITTQYLTGSYRANFPDLKEIKSVYFYDKSNRLKKTEKYSTKYYALEGEYSFDPDGNFLTHTRSFNGDNFNYDYYPYTNKLRKVTGTENQFTYDYNGNMTNDYLKNNTGIKYDHRNLITEIKKYVGDIDPPATYITTYKYDEAGNRIQKSVLKNDGTAMETIVNEFYVRDAQGKEIAIYQNETLDFWNVFGMGNEGRIKSTGTNYFYLKDHLGSTRAVLNQNNELVGAQDYDAWGYLARSWDTTATRYKFTGKERDNESTYDYFGARYYDSRIGRWGQMEPIYNDYLSFSPYQYGLLNALFLKDANGKDVIIHGDDAQNVFKNLNDAMINITLQINENGKISYEGTAQTPQEKMLVEAIKNENIIVNLLTVSGNYINEGPFAVGFYNGSKKGDGKINTEQYFNIEHAIIWEQAGGSSIGKSALHEILESYIGGKLFPGEYGYKEKNFQEAHKKTVELEKPKEYYPMVKHYYLDLGNKKKIHWKTTLYNQLSEKEYILYKNEEARKYKKEDF